MKELNLEKEDKGSSESLKLGFRLIFEDLLRRPKVITEDCRYERLVVVWYFVAVAAVSMLVFGVLLGTFTYGHQLWAAPVKLVGGLVFAGLICFPSLYIFASLAGSRASLLKMGGYMAASLALAGILLLGFAPAVWIIAQGTSSLGLMGALALSAWILALGFGYRILRDGLKETGAKIKTPVVIWAGIFLLVTLQLSTTLRPILGESDDFLTPEKKFFLAHWVGSLNGVVETDASDDAERPPKPREQVNPFE